MKYIFLLTCLMTFIFANAQTSIDILNPHFLTDVNDWVRTGGASNPVYVPEGASTSGSAMVTVATSGGMNSSSIRNNYQHFPDSLKGNDFYLSAYLKADSVRRVRLQVSNRDKNWINQNYNEYFHIDTVFRLSLIHI